MAVQHRKMSLERPTVSLNGSNAIDVLALDSIGPMDQIFESIESNG